MTKTINEMRKQYFIEIEENEIITIKTIKKAIESLEFLFDCKVTSIEVYGYFTQGYGRDWYPIELTNSNKTFKFNCKYGKKKLWYTLKIEEQEINIIKLEYEA